MVRSDRKRFTWTVGVALATLLAACNTLIGLSDLEKGECGGGRCEGGPSPNLDAGPDVAVDAGPDVEVRGADPTAWAQWPMPNYDGGADLLPHPLKYNVLDNDRLEDSVTHLVWRRAVLATPQTYDDAKRSCAALDRATGPWRLPKRIELVTLLDFGRTSFLIDPLFTGVKNVRVWTSSEKRPFNVEPDAYWTVNFETGVVEVLSIAGGAEARVLCVRGR